MSILPALWRNDAPRNPNRDLDSELGMGRLSGSSGSYRHFRPSDDRDLGWTLHSQLAGIDWLLGIRNPYRLVPAHPSA